MVGNLKKGLKLRGSSLWYNFNLPVILFFNRCFKCIQPERFVSQADRVGILNISN